MLASGGVVTEMSAKEALAACFDLARQTSNPAYREYIREIAGGESAVTFVTVPPGSTVERLVERLYWVEKHDDQPDAPMLVALPDDSQPFGYRFLTVHRTDPGWRSTAAIYDDPELLAALTDETTIGDYGPVPEPPSRS